MKINPLLMTDSYKISHPRMYPQGTTYLKTYTESRGTLDYSDVDLSTVRNFSDLQKATAQAKVIDVPITWLGYQIFTNQLASLNITKDDAVEAREFFTEHFLGADFFPYDDIMYMIDRYDGKLAARIKAVAEGTTLMSHNVVATCESTDPRLPWITSFLETMQLRAAWYGPSVATRDMNLMKPIYKALMKSSDDPMFYLASRNHDFGARGSACSESAQIAGAVHALISGGSDTLEGIYVANKLYNAKMSAFSIPASEHSVTTAYGEANEGKIIEASLNNFPGAPLVANVADSYDFRHFIDVIIGQVYRDAIIASGKLYVARPDSGDAYENVRFMLESFERNFGVTVNSKGYKVLNVVRIINGDGNTDEQIAGLCKMVLEMGFSMENLAFGTGGWLHSGATRDTYRWATKLCLAEINGVTVPIRKAPKTDPTKGSRAGDLDLIQVGCDFKTIDRLVDTQYQDVPSALEVVYENGNLGPQYTRDDVQARILATLSK